MKTKNLKFGVAITAVLAFSMSAFTQSDIVWKKNFGGSGSDSYYSVIAVSDGIIAVGASQNSSFGNGDLIDFTGKGGYDAIIVKYDNSDNIVWKKNFGGSDADYFYGLTSVSDGIIAVGQSYSGSFGNGDWTGVTGKGESDATIVKFDNAGNVVWKKNFGGGTPGYANNDNYFNSVIVVSDGIIAVGSSDYACFGTGDWTGISGGSGRDAIIVKFDNAGNVLWKTSFSTIVAPMYGDDDGFFSVTAVSDGVIAVGDKYSMYMGTQSNDAIIVKYDNYGNYVWDKTLNGSAHYDSYQGITTVSDGIVAVGNSTERSFNNGIWAGIAGKGGTDAIIVKYDNAGNVLWKKNFGGSDPDYFEYITTISDGFLVAGKAYVNNTGDWTGLTGKGDEDAIIVKYDFNGNVQWKKSFGGKGIDDYHSVVAVSDGIVAAGESYAIPLIGIGSSFGNGDLIDLTGNGGGDAIIVKYSLSNTSIQELYQSPIAISPSPATDFISVSGLQGNEMLYVYNINGQQLLSRKASGETEQIAVSHLPTGIYLLKTNDGQMIKWVKK
ncbi:MAG: T9SS type A sorting domain-containing protein [Candidatus Azobacteroides sp.]|nr:T9SS type A sorting domain-containing protein [Candidatus Azobacteroides sp.]